MGRVTFRGMFMVTLALLAFAIVGQVLLDTAPPLQAAEVRTDVQTSAPAPDVDADLLMLAALEKEPADSPPIVLPASPTLGKELIDLHDARSVGAISEQEWLAVKRRLLDAANER